MKNEQIVWNYLTTHGLTDAGAAGFMACIYGESTFDPICCQGKSSSYRKTYTARVDSGYISRNTFATTGGGYGLCQWTSSGRKRNLYDFAKHKKTSIGDIKMQCAFIIHEIKASFKDTYRICSTTNDPQKAAQQVLLDYERPASVGPDAKPSDKKNKILQLRSRGQKYYDLYHGSQIKQKKDTQGTSKKTDSKTESKAKETGTVKIKTDTRTKVAADDVSGEIKLGGLRKKTCIYADGKLVWEPGLTDPEYVIFEPKLTLELNSAGSLEFVMSHQHRLYSSIKRLSTTITVKTTDDDVTYKLVWRGRVLDTDSDFYNFKRVYCEGELSFLNDSVIRPYRYEIKPSLMFDYLIKKHNGVVSENRRFTSWRTDMKINDDDTWLHLFENTEYESAYDNLSNQFLDSIGGYVKALNGKITYSQKPGGVGDQVIRFGVGILDLEEHISAADIYTVIIPLGGLVPTTVTQDGEETKIDKRRTVIKANDGKDYIENQTGIGLWGRIERAVIWDDITDAGALKSLGKAQLKEAIKQSVSIGLSGIDMHLLDVDTEELYLGFSYRIVSEPHGIDTYFVLTSAEYDLTNPANNTYSFGAAFSALTSKVVNSSKKAKKNSSNIDSIKSGLMS